MMLKDVLHIDLGNDHTYQDWSWIRAMLNASSALDLCFCHTKAEEQ